MNAEPHLHRSHCLSHSPEGRVEGWLLTMYSYLVISDAGREMPPPPQPILTGCLLPTFTTHPNMHTHMHISTDNTHTPTHIYVPSPDLSAPVAVTDSESSGDTWVLIDDLLKVAAGISEMQGIGECWLRPRGPHVRHQLWSSRPCFPEWYVVKVGPEQSDFGAVPHPTSDQTSKNVSIEFAHALLYVLSLHIHMHFERIFNGSFEITCLCITQLLWFLAHHQAHQKLLQSKKIQSMNCFKV